MTQYIELGGVERPVRFGFSALYQYEQRTGRNALVDFATMQGGGASVSLMVDLLFAGLCAGTRHEKLAVDYTQEDVADWIGSDTEVLQKAASMFAESFPKEAGEGEGQKKAKPLKSIRGQA
jgi:hypothetical protein